MKNNGVSKCCLTNLKRTNMTCKAHNLKGEWDAYITIIFNILPYIKYIKLTKFNKIFDTDYVSFIWKLEAYEYFGIGAATPPKPLYLKLNPNWYSHTELFISKAEEYLKILNLEQYLDQLEDEYLPELL